MRRRPYQVVLFDEIEKAHPDVFNVLLQMLDDGRLTDCQGRTVDFRNTVIIMTSNIGSTTLIEAGEVGPDASRQPPSAFDCSLREHFRPEFLNRIDEIIVFKPLDRGAAAARSSACCSAASSSGWRSATSAGADRRRAARSLAREGYDPVYGARPLRRAIQRRLENPLARRILSAEFHAGDTVTIDVGTDGGLTFNGSAEPPPAPRTTTAPGSSTSTVH